MAVATTTQVADFTRNVGGDRVDVRGLVRPGADPHDYEPRPSDARAVAEADVVFRSGGEVDEWLEDVLANAGEDVPEVNLIDSVGTIEGDGETDPHWWQDPATSDARRGRDREPRWSRPTRTAARCTTSATPRRYGERLRALDRSIAACVERVPAAQRKLVTTHDAFSATSRERYGIEVIGALHPVAVHPGPALGQGHGGARRADRARGREGDLPRERAQSEAGGGGGARVGRRGRHGRCWADSLGPEGPTAETYLEAHGRRHGGDGRGLQRGAAPLHAGHSP